MGAAALAADFAFILSKAASKSGIRFWTSPIAFLVFLENNTEHQKETVEAGYMLFNLLVRGLP